MSFFNIIPKEIVRNHVYMFLDLRDIMNLDVSVINTYNEELLQSLNGCFLRSEKIDDMVLEWVVLRKINLGKIIVGPLITHKTMHLVREYPYKREVILDGDASLIKRASRISSETQNLITSLVTRQCAHVGNAVVMSLVQQGSHIERVDVSGSQLTDPALISLAKWCPLLKVLNLSRCEDVSDRGMIAVSEGCPVLEEIRLQDCSSITDASIVSIASHCPLMKCIDLGCCENITDIAITALANSCRTLEEVDLGFTSVTDIGLLALAQNCPNMKSIKLTLSEVSHEAMVTAFQSWKGLEDVDVESCDYVRDETVHVLVQYCPCLNAINLSGCSGITDAAIKAIADNCPGLSEFYLALCQQLTIDGIVYLLTKCATLHSLWIGGRYLTETSLNAVVEHCHQLTELGLLRLMSLTEGPMLNIARKCKSLKTLRFDCYSVSIWECFPGRPLGDAFLALRPDVKICGFEL